MVEHFARDLGRTMGHSVIGTARVNSVVFINGAGAEKDVVFGGEQSFIVHVGTLRLFVLAISYRNGVCFCPGILRAGSLGNLSFA